MLRNLPGKTNALQNLTDALMGHVRNESLGAAQEPEEGAGGLVAEVLGGAVGELSGVRLRKGHHQLDGFLRDG